jgi:hypothetical protein
LPEYAESHEERVFALIIEELRRSNYRLSDADQRNLRFLIRRVPNVEPSPMLMTTVTAAIQESEGSDSPPPVKKKIRRSFLSKLEDLFFGDGPD